MIDSPAMVQRMKSPARASRLARPAQCHCRLKMTSPSRAKIAGEV
jgi:hypothetical protein